MIKYDTPYLKLIIVIISAIVVIPLVVKRKHSDVRLRHWTVVLAFQKLWVNFHYPAILVHLFICSMHLLCTV